MNKIVIAKNIFKTYTNIKGVEVEVLKDVSIEIPEKKISVIIGASGAGKSTLLHILGGLDKPKSGTVIIDGTNIFSLNGKELTRFRNLEMGFIFQFHHLLPEFSAEENVAIPMMIKGESKRAALDKARTLLDKLELQIRYEHKPAELSGGEQQRVAVARALINDPPILFADEPTGNLDSLNSENLHLVFKDLRDNFDKTLVIVTHNQELIKIADHLFEMKDGKIISQ